MKELSATFLNINKDFFRSIAFSYNATVGNSMKALVSDSFQKGNSGEVSFLLRDLDYREIFPKAKEIKKFCKEKITDKVYSQAFFDAISQAKKNLPSRMH